MQEGLPKFTPEAGKEKKVPEVFFKSVAHEGHPERNEDSVLQDPEYGNFGVFDGLGGCPGGEVASQMTRDFLKVSLKFAADKLPLSAAKEALRAALLGANNRIMAQQEIDPERSEMGTTVSLVKIWEGSGGEKKIIVGHAGDSRVYIFSPAGELEQITADDDMVLDEITDKERVAAIEKKLSSATDPSALTPEEKYFFDLRDTIINFMGRDYFEPRISAFDIHSGDRLILTSDGVHDNLTDEEIAAVLKVAATPQEAAENLIKAAQARSRDRGHLRAKPDDMTVVIAIVN